MPKAIPLTKGYAAIVDDEDYDRVSQWKWSADVGKSGKVYARRGQMIEGKQIKIYLHRFLLGASPDLEVDHWDGDGLNNQKHNLRQCSHQQNHCNRTQNRSAAGFLGVTKKRNKFAARIFREGKIYRLGVFATPEEAAEAYDKASRSLSPVFGAVNFKD